MKRIVLVGCLLAAMSAAAAAEVGPAARAARQNRQAVAQLFAEGNAPAAITALQAQLKPEEKAGGEALALTDRLVAISCTLYNRKEYTAARLAALTALEVAAPLVRQRGMASERRHKDFHATLAGLSENVLHDLDLAKSYTALAASSSLATAEDRRRDHDLGEKIKLRNSRGNK